MSVHKSIHAPIRLRTSAPRTPLYSVSRGAIKNSWVNIFFPTRNVINCAPTIFNLALVIPLAAVRVARISDVLIPGFITLRLAPESTNTWWKLPSISISSNNSGPVIPTCDRPTVVHSIAGSTLGIWTSNPDRLGAGQLEKFLGSLVPESFACLIRPFLYLLE